MKPFPIYMTRVPSATKSPHCTISTRYYLGYHH